ncbi:hypothetical protein DMUE_1032 [Dictyocoela muelleri]|nr:hypothetical protein DMUE_1032 [Dictyocoela muelleri]
MKNKSKNAYIKIFNYIKSGIDNSYPDYITIDFEMASLLAFKQVFYNSKVTGCFFHYTQLLFRRVQKLGLTNLYKNNIKIRETIRMFFGLAFVPMEALRFEYEKLRKYILNNDILNGIHSFLSDFHNSFGKKH